MSSQRTGWSTIFPLEMTVITRAVPTGDRFGVYRVRAISKGDKSVAIQRCLGTDDEGILHIGEGWIRTRLQAFRRGTLSGNDANASGNFFHEYGFQQQFPLDSLHFDFIETDNKEQAEKLEFSLHAEYRNRFHDKPPLDSSIGKKKP